MVKKLCSQNAYIFKDTHNIIFVEGKGKIQTIESQLILLV